MNSYSFYYLISWPLHASIIQTSVNCNDDSPCCQGRPSFFKHVRDSLDRSGYSPVITGDPDEALSLMDETRPHVVLLDLMLPVSDGVELMRDIHSSHDTPVIFLSAYDQDELIAKAFENGAVDYIVNRSRRPSWPRG